MKFKFLIFLIFAVSSRIIAQEGSLPVPAKVVLDTLNKSKGSMLPADSILKRNYKTENTVYQKSFEPNFQKKYNTKEFNYSIIKPHESLWERIKRNISRLIRKIFGDVYPLASYRYTVYFLWFLPIVSFPFVFFYFF